jgi:hypothetical protein
MRIPDVVLFGVSGATAFAGDFVTSPPATAPAESAEAALASGFELHALSASAAINNGPVARKECVIRVSG